MARLQEHDDKPAVTLGWSELLGELEATGLDYGSGFERGASIRDHGSRLTELRDEIDSRVNRAELAYPGSLAILEGRPL